MPFSTILDSLKPPEPEKPFLSGSNTFLKLLDLINTPQQMIAGGIQSIQQGTDPIQGAIRGARNDASFSDVLENAGIGGTTGKVAGTAMDMILDPVNLIPLGFGGKMIAKGVKATPFLNSIINKSPWVKRILPELMTEAEQRVYMLRSRGLIKRDKAILEKVNVKAEDFAKRMQDIGKAHALDLDKLTRTLTYSGELPDTVSASLVDVAAREIGLTSIPSAALDEIATEVSKFRTEFSDALLAEKAALLGTMELDDESLNYVTHLLTKEARIKLGLRGHRTEAAKMNRGVHSFQHARKWRGKTIEELNKLAKTGDLPGYPKVKINRLFETDPARILQARLVASERAIADTKFFIDAADELAIDAASAPAHYRKLGFLDVEDPRTAPLREFLGDKAFEPEVATHLESIFNAVTQPRSTNNFLAALDMIQNRWKGLTLVPFPAYHARNYIGNMWNNNLAGMGAREFMPKGAYSTATNYQMRKAPTNAVDLGTYSQKIEAATGHQTRFADLEKLLEDYGITNQFRSYMGVDTVRDVNTAKRLMNTIENIGKGKVVQTGFKFATKLEDNARIAHFVWHLRQSGDPLQAAMSVKKYLFNYNELTDFEKGVLRRIFPFYAWTRFNLPLQVQSLVNNPKAFQKLGDVVNQFRRNTTQPSDMDQLLAGWIQDNSGIPVRNDQDGNPEYLLLGGWIPSADLNKLLSKDGVIDELVSQLSPLIKAPIEAISGKSLYLGKDLENFPGEQEEFVGKDMSAKAANTLKNFRILAEIDRFLKTEEIGGTLGIQTKDGQNVKDVVLRFLLGAKTYPVDVRKQRMYRKYKELQLRRHLKIARKNRDQANEELLRGMIEREDY